MNIFERAAEIGLPYIKSWLPAGHEENGQWVCLNPNRNDSHEGSFKINLTTGAFNDYADDEMVGKDCVTLYARLNNLTNYEAAHKILETYDNNYFPGAYKELTVQETWTQVHHAIKNTPELPEQKNEIARWDLEQKRNGEWLPIMKIVRFKKGDGKIDYPFTLWTDCKNYEWRSKALHGMKYPLYNLRSLEEKPNARVLLVEGQKVAGVLKDVLNDWAVVGWYGGAKNASLTDLTALKGREVWFSFDADNVGRQAIDKIKKILPDTLIHLVYPPFDVPQGWDLADAVLKDGWTIEQLEEHITKGEPSAATVPDLQRLTACVSPIRFTPITEDEKFRIRSQIIEEKNSGVNKQTGEVITKEALVEDWIGKWVECDVQLANSIMQDYTTGIKSTAYDNKNEWLGAVERRADELQIPQSNLTENVLKKLERAIELRGKKYNQVADYMDSLKNLYKETDDSLLDQFMKIFTFDFPIYEGEDPEDYEKRVAESKLCYREMFDKFFLKMHGHINGTRRNENGEYKGLMENDIVPILAGGQGIGKTTLVRYIAMEPELYTDLGSGLKAKFGAAETVKKVRGKLLVEIGEMKVMKNADDVEQVKSFISQTSVNVDIKYVESQYQTPLTCSYIGTSNPTQYLTDPTGNRRWNPVKIKKIDMDFMSSAEGKELIRKLHAHYSRKTDSMSTYEVRQATLFSKELNDFMEELRSEALITYSDYEACYKVVSIWLNGDDNRKPALPGEELLQADVEKMCFEYGYRMRISQKSCIRAMEDLGLIQVKSRVDGKIKTAWVKPQYSDDDCPF